MPVLSGIVAFVKLLGSLVGWGKQRDAEENTPQMQANALGATEQRIEDKAEKDVASGDVKAVETDIAE